MMASRVFGVGGGAVEDRQGCTRGPASRVSGVGGARVLAATKSGAYVGEGRTAGVAAVPSTMPSHNR